MFGFLKKNGENPTITRRSASFYVQKKDRTVAKYSLLEGSQQIFASKFQFYLPTEAKLEAEVQKDFEAYEISKGLAEH